MSCSYSPITGPQFIYKEPPIVLSHDIGGIIFDTREWNYTYSKTGGD